MPRSDALAALLIEHPLGRTPTTYALAALMCLNAARLPAKVDSAGNLSTLFDQNRTQWDQKLIGEGLAFLELSAAGVELSEFHLEAAFATAHARAAHAEDTDWGPSFYYMLLCWS